MKNNAEIESHLKEQFQSIIEEIEQRGYGPQLTKKAIGQVEEAFPNFLKEFTSGYEDEVLTLEEEIQESLEGLRVFTFKEYDRKQNLRNQITGKQGGQKKSIDYIESGPPELRFPTLEFTFGAIAGRIEEAAKDKSAAQKEWIELGFLGNYEDNLWERLRGEFERGRFLFNELYAKHAMTFPEDSEAVFSLLEEEFRQICLNIEGNEIQEERGELEDDGGEAKFFEYKCFFSKAKHFVKDLYLFAYKIGVEERKLREGLNLPEAPTEQIQSGRILPENHTMPMSKTELAALFGKDYEGRLITKMIKAGALKAIPISRQKFIFDKSKLPPKVIKKLS